MRQARHGMMIAAALLLASCGKPGGAGDAGFKTALQAWHDAHPVCVVLLARFPYELRVKGREGERRRFDALAQAGLLSVESFQKPESDIRGGTVPADYLRYRVTDAGAAVLHPVDAPMADNTDLCFAQKRVTAIKGFTEPAEALGVRSSRVTYDWTLDKVAAWASSPAVREAWPAIANTLNRSTGESTDTLVETDQGWRRRDGGR